MNDLTVTQIANIVNEAVEQATGSSAIANLSTKDFVSVAQTALLTGTDNLAVGLSQVLARTVFAVRPYTRTFRGLERTNQEFGNHVRKINYLDEVAIDDQGYPITVTTPTPGTIGVTEGNSVDMYTINLPKVIQTNFYGSGTYEFNRTFSRNQLRKAFTSAGEFNRFVQGVMTHDRNQREQRIDVLSRGCISNFIGGKLEADTKNVIKLVSVYNSTKGTELTTDTVRQPANWQDFARWAYGYIKTLVQRMGERSYKYHLNPTTGNIARQTGPSDMHMFMLADFENSVDAEVLANTYNDRYLSFVNHETVNYWQSIDSPNAINVTASWMTTAGTVATSSDETEQSNIIGLICDRDAVGYTLFNESVDTTPFNARGRYYNVWYNWEGRYYNDNTENAVVLLLE